MISSMMKGWLLMKSRMEKYYDENEQYIQKRTNRNSELYKEINNSELSDYNITSNAKVIGENESNSVNVDRLKEILEKNYHPVTKKTSVKIAKEINEEPITLEQTREYDINTILEKARATKEVDYEKERLKKIRDTQYDILKNLDINNDQKESKVADSKTKEELLNLIHTITENELQKTKANLDPLDLFTDLKGDENTMVLGAEELEQQKDIIVKTEEKKEKKVDDSFYTNSLSFTQSDFDDFNDLKDDVASNRIIIRILIILVVIGIIVGTVILLNGVLKLGLF